MKIIGHRGAAALAAESSLAAVAAGLAAGADAVEVDVQFSGDGVALLWHDDYMQEKNQKVYFKDCSYQELLKLKPDLARLDDLLETFAAKTELLIEIKSPKDAAATLKVCQKFLGHPKKFRLRFLSFSFKALKLIKQLAPNADVVVNDRWSGVRATYRAKRLDTKDIQMNHRWLWLGFIKSVKRSGFRLTVYTVNQPTKIKRWRPFIYGVITDNPELFIKK